ncbi:MAG: hypothetical protein M1383_02265 [Patescibacteria group bacterium]|nr:hypothetical protein [Patescibacteria group bacterium]
MKNIKKALAGLALAAVMAVGGFAVTSQAHAQALGGAYNNPISQWIVLSGLFNPYGTFGTVGGTGTAGGTTGGAYGVYNNPISQWIVLSGLFNPYGTIGY